MFQDVIAGYTEIAAGQFSDGLKLYQSALTGTPLDHDGRVTLFNLLTSSPDTLNALPKDEAEADLTYIVSLAQKNVANNPADSLNQMQLAEIYDTAARYNYQDLTLFNDYSSQAITAIDRSIEASPGRAPVYLAKAQMQLARGEITDAIATINYAISLNPNYYEGYCRLAQFDFFLKDQATSTKVTTQDINSALDACVDLGGGSSINSNTLLMTAVNYLVANRDYPRALKLAQRLAELNVDNSEIWINLAKLYLIVGDSTNAQAAAQKAISLNSSLSTDWTSFSNTVGNLLAPSATTTPKK
jgi:tetratricopeptide (TPR) repeat protein